MNFWNAIGLFLAMRLKEKYCDSSILILERIQLGSILQAETVEYMPAYYKLIQLKQRSAKKGA